ncbi:hypothetical protein C7M84_011447 [Penaeus vannamei]|uniref:Uncharacterized protein n=1 Tax=Penaeus vannamei TaxID=6689 RepID=A0A3R7QKG0_PENVA|nr:hypothetical protein C7M84_011447 [Penaeus vannamei]
MSAHILKAPRAHPPHPPRHSPPDCRTIHLPPAALHPQPPIHLPPPPLPHCRPSPPPPTAIHLPPRIHTPLPPIHPPPRRHPHPPPPPNQPHPPHRPPIPIQPTPPPRRRRGRPGDSRSGSFSGLLFFLSLSVCLSVCLVRNPPLSLSLSLFLSLLLFSLTYHLSICFLFYSLSSLSMYLFIQLYLFYPILSLSLSPKWSVYLLQSLFLSVYMVYAGWAWPLLGIPLSLLLHTLSLSFPSFFPNSLFHLPLSPFPSPTPPISHTAHTTAPAAPQSASLPLFLASRFPSSSSLPHFLALSLVIASPSLVTLPFLPHQSPSLPFSCALFAISISHTPTHNSHADPHNPPHSHGFSSIPSILSCPSPDPYILLPLSSPLPPTPPSQNPQIGGLSPSISPPFSPFLSRLPLIPPPLFRFPLPPPSPNPQIGPPSLAFLSPLFTFSLNLHFSLPFLLISFTHLTTTPSPNRLFSPRLL